MRSQMMLFAVGAVLVGFGGRAPEASVATSLTPVPAVVTNAPVASAVAKAENPAETTVRNAVEALSPHVTNKSDDRALRSAITAYYNFKAANPEAIKKPYLYFIDYGLSNTTARGYVFNMQTLEVVEGPFIVAHGRGSGPKNAVPMNFSNRHGSAATSLGLYVTQETYGFSGKTAGRHYTSIGLRMSGESGRFNSNARGRGVVVHGAPYVSASGSGRSEGCPAMEQTRARRLIPMIANGAVVFQYSPNDADWLTNDPWVNG
jgi:L,D-transpeptidase catalytic domain